VSPLRRYYLSWAGVALIALFVAAAGPGNLQVAGVIVLLLLAVFAVFIRCPSCRTRLSGMGDSPGIHGLPGRHCPKCGADLGRT
jgi:membrane protein implicated in regulation of membrane protease activity